MLEHMQDTEAIMLIVTDMQQPMVPIVVM